jgi:S1-C subfamily serine protease
VVGVGDKTKITASGFVIETPKDRIKLVLTNHHVCEDKGKLLKSIFVYADVGTTPYQAKPVRFSAKLDLCLIKVEDSVFFKVREAIKIHNNINPALNSEIYTIGFPLAQKKMKSGGTVISFDSLPAYKGMSMETLYKASLLCLPGMSGSPVFDKNTDTLVGVVEARALQENDKLYFIPIESVRTFLKENGL